MGKEDEAADVKTNDHNPNQKKEERKVSTISEAIASQYNASNLLP